MTLSCYKNDIWGGRILNIKEGFRDTRYARVDQVVRYKCPFEGHDIDACLKKKQNSYATWQSGQGVTTYCHKP